mmetsp:Transcript_123391/g.308277  ORF Transcript_123391/g.308277 Transcript_123391/m.308277 type:complete len:615 (+) Transcript_123391:181-2025(+)
MHHALDVLEGMERNLRREARRPVRLPAGGLLLASILTLHKDVEGVHLFDAKHLEARAEVPVLLAVLAGGAVGALLPAVEVVAHRPLGEDLNGPVHSQEAIVDVHATCRLLLPEGALLARDHLPEAARQEEGVRIDLDDPIVLPSPRVLHHALPEAFEDDRVHRGVELAAPGSLQAAIDEDRIEFLVVAVAIHRKRLITEHCPLVAILVKDPEALLELHSHKVDLVGAGQHQRDAEERCVGAVRGHHLVGLGFLLLDPGLCNVGVVLLAAAIEGQRVVVLGAGPLVVVIATLHVQDFVARAGRARLRATGLFAQEVVVLLLELRPSGLSGEAVIHVRPRVDARLHVPLHLVVALHVLPALCGRAGEVGILPALLVLGVALDLFGDADHALLAFRGAVVVRAATLPPKLLLNVLSVLFGVGLRLLRCLLDRQRLAPGKLRAAFRLRRSRRVFVGRLLLAGLLLDLVTLRRVRCCRVRCCRVRLLLILLFLHLLLLGAGRLLLLRAFRAAVGCGLREPQGRICDAGSDDGRCLTQPAHRGDRNEGEHRKAHGGAPDEAGLRPPDARGHRRHVLQQGLHRRVRLDVCLDLSRRHRWHGCRTRASNGCCAISRYGCAPA